MSCLLYTVGLYTIDKKFPPKKRKNKNPEIAHVQRKTRLIESRLLPLSKE
jgi:hypothetical protein